MIFPTLQNRQLQSWQHELANLITHPAELLNYLHLEQSWLEPAIKAAERFPLRTTRSYANRIEPGNPFDPLLQQILPLGIELESISGYTPDPLAEKQANVAPGLVHKYHGRVLFITAPQCAINCRYCFRRHFDYGANTPSRAEWEVALDYIRQEDSIEEVILSGGDPLVLADKQLQWLLEKLESIPHLERLRIHSRLPIVLPQRITVEFLQMLSKSRLQPVMVVHCNHPQEINADVAESLLLLKNANITTLNQSVLLKGINDSSSVLTRLSKLLFKHGVLPYYLHLLDKVAGAAHFDLSEQKAKTLYSELLGSLPGYLVPKLVRECPQVKYKIPVTIND